MAMSDNIREGVSQRKADSTPEETLRNLINNAASTSLKQFLQRMEAGEIPIDNMADLMRVVNIYKEINDIDSAIGGASGGESLPALNMKQGNIIEQRVEEGKASTDETGNIDVSDMSEEDIADMIRDMDIEQNSANEETF